MRRRRPPYSEMVAQMLLDLAEGEEHVHDHPVIHAKGLEAPRQQGHLSYVGPSEDGEVELAWRMRPEHDPAPWLTITGTLLMRMASAVARSASDSSGLGRPAGRVRASSSLR